MFSISRMPTMTDQTYNLCSVATPVQQSTHVDRVHPVLLEVLESLGSAADAVDRYGYLGISSFRFPGASLPNMLGFLLGNVIANRF